MRTEQVRAMPHAVETSKTSPRFYRAFGLTISSELPLPELDEVAAGGPADVKVRLRPIARPGAAQATQNVTEFGDHVQYMHWPIVGAFQITGTDTIDIDPTPGASEAYLAFPLLGPVFSVLLHLRGLLVLHASAIALGDRCVIFAGDKLAGKSTTAAAFLRAGHKLLTDDVVAIGFDEVGQPFVAPGYAQVKLAADAQQAIPIAGAQALPLVHPGFEKHQHRLSQGFLAKDMPAVRLYLLQRGEKAEVTRLPPGEALHAVMRFAYVTRFADRAVGADPAHLRNCARLASTLQVCRLEVPTGLERIDEAVRRVEQDIAG